MKKNTVMIKAGKKAAEKRKQNQIVKTMIMSEAGRKAWRTRRANAKKKAKA